MAKLRKYVAHPDPAEDRRRQARAILAGARSKLSRSEMEELRSIIDGNPPDIEAWDHRAEGGTLKVIDSQFTRLLTEFAHLLK